MEAVITIAENLDENPTNMDIIMPSLAAFLAIRDKNYEGMIKALVFLKRPSINLLKKLAHSFARDFEDDLVAHVMPEQKTMMGGPS